MELGGVEADPAKRTFSKKYGEIFDIGGIYSHLYAFSQIVMLDEK